MCTNLPIIGLVFFPLNAFVIFVESNNVTSNHAGKHRNHIWVNIVASSFCDQIDGFSNNTNTALVSLLCLVRKIHHLKTESWCKKPGNNWARVKGSVF